MPYKVETPSGVLADGEWDTRTEIPERVADRFERYFETAEARVIPLCSVCRTTEKVHELDLGAAGIMWVPFCEDCWNSGKSKEWLRAEFEAALMEDPTMHKNSDGTWSEREPV